MAYYRSVGMNYPIQNSWYSIAANNNNRLAHILSQKASAVTKVRPVERNFEKNGVSTKSSEFLKKFQKQMIELQQAATDLSDTKVNGVANRLAAVSSDQNVMDVSAVGKLTSPAVYQVDVQQTAAAQQNQSLAAWASGAPADKGTFAVETQKGTAQLHIDPSAVKTNRELYNAIADEINRLDLGVTAKAQEANGKVSLTVSSAETGKENAFSINGTLAEKMGLTKEKQAAQDAVYTVKKENDKGQAAQEKTSASNRITLDDEKIEATLKKAGSTQIKVGDDVKGMADKLDNLVKSYNNTVKFLNDNAGQGSGVLDQLRRMSRLPTGEKAMNLAGISVNPKDGTFAFDRDAFAEAMETSPTLTKEIVSGSYGVAQGLRQDTQSGLNTSSAKLVDAMDSFRASQDFINRMAQNNMLNQWSYSPLGTYSKANSYNLFQYFTSGAMMSMYI